MRTPQNLLNISVIWRGRKFLVEMNSNATLKDLGNELLKLADVKEDTMRFIVPQHSSKSSILLYPFSDDHSSLSLIEASIHKGNPIRMMGVSKDDVEKVMQNSKVDLRIAGFDEEEKRFRQRMLERPAASLKLPQGNYIFCDFRSLAIPGVVLNPPPSEALKRMHMLASDPGIVAIMNKHRWRVGIMTEMAPEGYVGVSPKCILGFNKNQGEEISLRLRTDDLKGFRKYESIKKTLLHELAHMVYSEHDARFYSLDKQLNQEAASLDWTRSRSHTLSSFRHSEHYEEEFGVVDSNNYSHKVGGSTTDQLDSARATSVAAAYRRLSSASVNSLGVCEVHEDTGFHMHEEPNHINSLGKEPLYIQCPNDSHWKHEYESNHDDCSSIQNKLEPVSDNFQDSGIIKIELLSEINERTFTLEPVGDDSEVTQFATPLRTDGAGIDKYKEPDLNDLETYKLVMEPDPEESEAMEITGNNIRLKPTIDELNPVHSEDGSFGYGNVRRPDKTDSMIIAPMENNLEHPPGLSNLNLGDEELQRIQDPVTVFCSRLQKAIEMLRSEFPTEATIVLQTLFKLIRNLIDHPSEMRFKKVRKLNPTFQRNVANYKAAMEILFLIGFNEEIMMDEIGKAETYLVLKRNDPGLLWLAKSSLEICIAC